MLQNFLNTHVANQTKEAHLFHSYHINNNAKTNLVSTTKDRGKRRKNSERRAYWIHEVGMEQ
jgi:hypothetical protein